MKISEVSAKTGLSTYTLRFYEKQGFIRAAKNQNGHREYTEKDLELINWIACLKNSGMSLNRIKEYVNADKTESSEVLISILTEHLMKLAQQQEKINHYQYVTQNKLNRLKNT